MKLLDASARAPRAAALLASLLLALPAAADPPIIVIPPSTSPIIDFSGLWSEATPETQLYMADDLADLEDHAAALELLGWRLFAFESWLTQGGRRYAGVFHVGSGSRVLVTGLNAVDFEAERLAQVAASRFLIDVEVELVGGVRVYSGLFRTAFSTSEVVRDNYDAADLATEIATLSTYRLLAFDTWWESGEMRSYAVFRPGSSIQETVLGLSWDDFWDEVEDFADLGYRLVDIEITEVPAADARFSGRFVVKTAVPDWLSVFFSQEINLTTNHTLFAEGYYVSSLNFDPEDDVVELPGEPLGMIDLEVNRNWVPVYPSGGPVQARPLHDSGTPGPPRWP